MNLVINKLWIAKDIFKKTDAAYFKKKTVWGVLGKLQTIIRNRQHRGQKLLAVFTEYESYYTFSCDARRKIIS